jgi:hypothetical protein
MRISTFQDITVNGDVYENRHYLWDTLSNLMFLLSLLLHLPYVQPTFLVSSYESKCPALLGAYNIKVRYGPFAEIIAIPHPGYPSQHNCSSRDTTASTLAFPAEGERWVQLFSS